MPNKQLNSRTAPTLLAVAGIGADQQWAETGRRPLGINEIINWMELTYPAIRKVGSTPRNTLRIQERAFDASR